MPFLIGDLTVEQYASSTPRRLSCLSEAKEVKDGEVVEFLGHALVYDAASFVSEEECLKWRSVGDPKCDKALTEALNASFTTTGRDLLDSVQRCAQECPGAVDTAAFMKEVSTSPPDDIAATAQDLRIAQDFFFDHYMQLHIGILYYAIVGGFSSPRIFRTLESLSYLGKPSPDAALSAEEQEKKAASTGERVWSRLLETMQFFLDIMGCTDKIQRSSDPNDKLADLLPGGEGWKSAVRIRLLHAVVRRRVSSQYKRKTQPYPGTRPDDVPISVEDMATTLAAFSVVPIWMLKRMGLRPRPEQTRAFISLWRHVGFYLGVPVHVLRKHFLDIPTSDTFLASMLLNVFSDTITTDPTQERSPSLAVLAAATKRAPSWMSLTFHLAVARSLLGDHISDCRGLTQTAPAMRATVNVAFFVLNAPVSFGYWYARKEWLESYRATIREGLVDMVRRGLGMRRVTFYPHIPIHGAGAISDQDDDHKKGGEMTPQPLRSRGFALASALLLVEMVLILSVSLVLPAVFAWHLIR